jgi:hypothetical protein
MEPDQGREGRRLASSTTLAGAGAGAARPKISGYMALARRSIRSGGQATAVVVMGMAVVMQCRFRVAATGASRLRLLAQGLGLALLVGPVDELNQPVKAAHQLRSLGQLGPGGAPGPRHNGLAEPGDAGAVGQVALPRSDGF